MAIPMSYLPNRMVSAVCWMALAAVAQALNTLVNVMPVSPTRRGTRAGVEHPGVSRVGIGHLGAAAEAELDVLPFQSGVGQSGLDRLGAHLHRGLVESAERVQAHADDGDVVTHLNSPPGWMVATRLRPASPRSRSPLDGW